MQTDLLEAGNKKPEPKRPNDRENYQCPKTENSKPAGATWPLEWLHGPWKTVIGTKTYIVNWGNLGTGVIRVIGYVMY